MGGMIEALLGQLCRWWRYLVGKERRLVELKATWYARDVKPYGQPLYGSCCRGHITKLYFTHEEFERARIAEIERPGIMCIACKDPRYIVYSFHHAPDSEEGRRLEREAARHLAETGEDCMSILF